jgi:shikimate dehydrogenase
VRPSELAAALEELPRLGLSGVNLTVPHKRAALPFMNRLTEQARRIGAVNTVGIEGGRLVGHNTDGLGFLAALAELPGAEVEHAIVLGSGGASLALVDALVEELGVPRLSRITRQPESIKHAMAGHPRVTPRGYDWLADEACAEPCSELLVNTTTVGMPQAPEEVPRQFPREFDLSCLRPSGRIVDIVYPASETGLMARGRDAGFAAQSGLPMLLWQGVRALEFWLNRPLAPEIVISMRAALGLEDR